MNHVAANKDQSVDAFLNFTIPVSEPQGDGIVLPGYPDNHVKPFPCRVHDARQLPGYGSLEREGFTLLKHETTFADERDREILRIDYQAEVAEFLKYFFKTPRGHCQRKPNWLAKIMMLRGIVRANRLECQGHIL